MRSVDMLERLLAAFDHSDWPPYLGRMRVTGFVLPAGRTDCTFVSQSFVLSIMVINLVVQFFAGFIYLGPRGLMGWTLTTRTIAAAAAAGAGNCCWAAFSYRPVPDYVGDQFKHSRRRCVFYKQN